MRGLHAGPAVFLLAAGLWACGQPAAGEVPGGVPSQGGPPQPAALVEYGAAKMPGGMASLCLRQPEFCAPANPMKAPLALSDPERELISEVNATVNHAIRAITDEKLYGQVEYWTLPADAGDCEDYVLLKRKMLAGRGLPTWRPVLERLLRQVSSLAAHCPVSTRPCRAPRGHRSR
jgi:predicted transglutaminase-like cysteine proteinase